MLRIEISKEFFCLFFGLFWNYFTCLKEHSMTFFYKYGIRCERQFSFALPKEIWSLDKKFHMKYQGMFMTVVTRYRVRIESN